MITNIVRLEDGDIGMKKTRTTLAVAGVFAMGGLLNLVSGTANVVKDPDVIAFGVLPINYPEVMAKRLIP